MANLKLWPHPLAQWQHQLQGDAIASKKGDLNHHDPLNEKYAFTVLFWGCNELSCFFLPQVSPSNQLHRKDVGHNNRHSVSQPGLDSQGLACLDENTGEQKSSSPQIFAPSFALFSTLSSMYCHRVGFQGMRQRCNNEEIGCDRDWDAALSSISINVNNKDSNNDNHNANQETGWNCDWDPALSGVSVNNNNKNNNKNNENTNDNEETGCDRDQNPASSSFSVRSLHNHILVSTKMIPQWQQWMMLIKTSCIPIFLFIVLKCLALLQLRQKWTFLSLDIFCQPQLSQLHLFTIIWIVLLKGIESSAMFQFFPINARCSSQFSIGRQQNG